MFVKPHLFYAVILILLVNLNIIAATNDKKVLNIQTWKTTNNVPVYFVQTPEVPMIEINVIFAAGSARDGDKPGLAQLTANTLNQGAAQLNADQIAKEFDKVGAQFNASVNRDMTNVSFQSLTDTKYLNPALEVFTKILTAPNFPAQAFQRAQKQILVAIAQQLQDPNSVAARAFYASIYPNHPYGHAVLGTKESISALSANDLKNFYGEYYVANNALITIVGDVSQRQAETIANQLLEKLPNGKAAAPLPTALALQQGNQQSIKFPSEQTHILIGQVGIDYKDLDYYSLIVGNYILGGAPLTSRLFMQVRELRGLAYTVGSGLVPLNAKGPFVIVLQTRNGKSNAALKVAKETLHEFINQGPTEKELIAAKKKIINGFPLTLAGNDAISSYLAAIGFYHLPLNYLDTYTQKIAAVTTQQIKNAFQTHIHPEQMITIMVGNTQQ